ncbi:hypothetical protein ACFY7H_24970 [Streptomyces sp. NPDC012794]|uniref:hypothetical protein n=1 Tax=Streptomyces sp. NPDC012794 TaxID=3364850 RepID=UPI0036AAE02D
MMVGGEGGCPRALAWWLTRTYPEHDRPDAKPFEQQLDEYRPNSTSSAPTTRT